jgi:Mce-associated membrane protein
VTAIVARWRGGTRAHRERRPVSLAVIALVPVVVVLAVAAVILFLRWQSGKAADSARTAAVTAANQEVPALLSYSYGSFGAALAKAKADTTPQFGATYTKLMSGQVESQATKDQVVTQATVSGTAIETSGSGSVTLLMFLNQQTKTNAKAQAVLNDTAVRVTMQSVNGTWLVGNLAPSS